MTKSGPLSRRKKEKKPLRCQTILAAAHKARPVNQAASRKGKLKGSVIKPAAKSLSERAVGPTDEGSEKSSLDLWEDRIAPDTAEQPMPGRSNFCTRKMPRCFCCKVERDGYKVHTILLRASSTKHVPHAVSRKFKSRNC